MAGDSVIGALRIVLGADTGSLEDGLKKSSEGLKSFARDAAAVASGIGLEKFVEKITESFVHLVKESINVADEMGKLSQKIGIPVESLSSLSVAAKLADVSIETFSKGIGIMNKQLVAAAAGGTDAAASAFKYLGISVKNIKDLKPEVAFGLVADKISQLDDGATKTAVSMAIFGARLGKELIPLLNTGAKGFEEMRVMAENLGLVISTSTAKQAEKFNDNVKLMGLAVQGVGQQVAAFFLPAMAKASESLIKWVADSHLVASASEVLIRAFVFIMDNAKLLGGILLLVFGTTIVRAIASLGLAILSLGAAMVAGAVASGVMAARFLIAFASVSLVAGAVLLLTGNLDKFLVSVENLAKDIPALGDVTSLMASGLKAAGVDVGALTKTFEQLKGDAGVKGLEDEFKKLYNTKPFDPKAAENAKKFGEEIAKITLKTKETSGAFDHLAPGFVQAAIHLKLLTEGAVGFTGSADQMTAGMMRLNTALFGLKAAEITKEVMPPWEKEAVELSKLNAVYQSTTLSVGAYNEKVLQIKAPSLTNLINDIKNFGKTMDDFAVSSLNNMASSFADVVVGSKSAADAWKDFGKAVIKALAEMLIKMLVVLPIAIALRTALGSLGGPFAFLGLASGGTAQAIGGAVSGIGGIGHAATGKTYEVPGGSMGVDTGIYSLALAPGELVDVTPAGKAQGGGGDGMLVINPIKSKDFFTGDMVREMVFSIDQWMRNGGTGVGFAKR